MSRGTDLLIIGAGPFGLAMARFAGAHGIDHTIVGAPMAFWRRNMPDGMCLRSGIQWHLDPENELTFRRFLSVRGLLPEDLSPLPIDVYLDYAQWFQRMSGTTVLDMPVRRLHSDQAGVFEAELVDGSAITASRVLLAIGLHAFMRVDPELAELLPPGRYTHSRDFVDMEAMRGKRCLIIGGRQSAFEWAALLADHGARAVHLVHRHPSPAFAVSDWDWVPPLLERTERDPGWFRALEGSEREAIERRFWEEGRLKVEPWLQPRLRPHIVTVRPNRELVACSEDDQGVLQAKLDDDTVLEVDHVILATGYKVDMRRLAFLDMEMGTRNGYPILDTSFQSTVPGLRLTSLAASQDFGPFMGFTVSVPASTRVIGRALLRA